MRKLRVGVFMGGKSEEREVSFNSGRTICDHLDTFRYDIIPIFQRKDGLLFILPWSFLHRGKISDFENRLEKEAKRIYWDYLENIIDFIYIAVHGKYAEDGTLQSFLELLNIPYLGTGIWGSALGMNKIMQYEFLKQNNLNVPNYIYLTPTQILNYNEQDILKKLEKNNIKFPCVVKPSQEGSSLGIKIVKKESGLYDALVIACTLDSKKDQDVIIEEKLEGMEFCSMIITNYKNNKLMPLPPTEVIIEKGSDFFDYEQKYMPGRATKYTPARCSKEIIQKIQHESVKVMETLNITNIIRVDGFVTKDNKIIFIDPNSLTGMGPASFLFRQASEVDMNHTKIINHLIETELHNYGLLKKIEDEEKKAFKKMKEKKIRVGVLFGGRDNEREISLESGRNVIYKLSPQKYETIPIFINSNLELFKIDQKVLVMNNTSEIEEVLNPNDKIKWDDLNIFLDFVFIALHGGVGENGTIQGILEMLGLPYNGSSVLTSALCMDKYKTNQFLKYKGFNVPIVTLISKDNWKRGNFCFSKLKYPLIAKPVDDGCSFFVKKAKTEKELFEIIEDYFNTTDKKNILLEEFVSGIELTVGVMGNEDIQVLPLSQVAVKKDFLTIEEKFLPGAGENQTPAPLPLETIKLIQSTIKEIYKSLNCKGYARIDCFYQKEPQEKVIILEVNTLPGMTPATCIFHQAAEVGLKPMDFIDYIVKLGLEEWKGKSIFQNLKKKVLQK